MLIVIHIYINSKPISEYDSPGVITVCPNLNLHDLHWRLFIIIDYTKNAVFREQFATMTRNNKHNMNMQ